MGHLYHGYVSHNQRVSISWVNLHFPMVFLWFSYGFSWKIPQSRPATSALPGPPPPAVGDVATTEAAPGTVALPALGGEPMAMAIPGGDPRVLQHQWLITILVNSGS